MISTTIIGTATAGASPNSGVTSGDIRIGIPLLDYSALLSVGIKLNQGNYQNAYDALIANLNAHGGIDGRHVVPYYVTFSPLSSASSQASCTQLTEDDQVFAVMAPYMAACYIQTHGTPTIAVTTQVPVIPSVPNFTLNPPPNAYDPLQLSVFAKLGLFKHKTVGVFAGNTTDDKELQDVQASLKKLGVKVTQTAVDSAPSSDEAASNQQVAVISQKFKSAGVNEVVAVGTGSSVWPGGLLANQSTYNPSWIATNATDLEGTIGGTTGGSNEASYLGTVTTSLPTPTSYEAWKDPLVKSCVTIIHKAYPSDEITPPTASGNSSDHTYVAPEISCQNLALFTTIAKAAGKHLTVASFAKAGYGLRHVTFPGSGGAVSFGPDQPYAIGTVYVGKYSPSANQIVFGTQSEAP
jgi:hypothetical protein